MNDAPSLVATALAASARQGALVIVAGAGVSAADPTRLPVGASVAELVAQRLEGEITLADDERGDLVAIGDRLEKEPGGSARLQQVLLEIAPFTTALPNFAHRVLALLIGEGVVPVMTFNWDDCIERAGEPLVRIQAVVNNADALQTTPPRDFKLHGCARRAGTLMVSSAHLAAPPTWAIDSVRAQLARGSILFLGVGDIPAYIEKRIEQLKVEVLDTSGIWVAARDISDQWTQLIPDLREDQKVAADADEFADELVRAYGRLVLSDAERASQAAAAGGGALEEAAMGFANLRSAIESQGADWLLELALGSALDWSPTAPVLDSSQMRRALVALGILSVQLEIALDSERRLTLGGRRLEIVISRDDVGPPSIAAEVERRIARRQQGGATPFASETVVLAAGQFGDLASHVLLRDVSGSSSPDAAADLVEATTAGRVRFLDASGITSGIVPELAA